MRCVTLPLKPLISRGVGILPAQAGRARRPSHKTLDQVEHRVYLDIDVLQKAYKPEMPISSM